MLQQAEFFVSAISFAFRKREQQLLLQGELESGLSYPDAKLAQYMPAMPGNSIEAAV